MIPQHNCNNLKKIINNNRKKHEIGVPLSATHPYSNHHKHFRTLRLRFASLKNGEITQRTHARRVCDPFEGRQPTALAEGGKRGQLPSS